MQIREYNRYDAVMYAHRWAYGRNPAYYDFEELGGDCTNYTSQCIYAGSNIMNYTPTFGWYYIDLNNRAPSWTGVPYLYNFLTKNTGVGPFGHEVSIHEVQPGDIVQMRFTHSVFEHSPIIVYTGSQPNIYNTMVAAHSTDADYRPIFTYNWSEIRFIHIDGVRYE